jgi:hypothetical protein
MREDAPSTEIGNSLSECANACWMLASPWAQQTPDPRRAIILDGVTWFVESAPLVELPNVEGPKQMIRRAAAIAGEVKDAVVAWDGTMEPPPSLVALARAFLVAVGMSDVVEPPQRPPGSL